MTQLKIEDLTESTTLDQHAMASLRGGLNAVINNSQMANQTIAGGLGPVTAFNSPISAPSTVLTENNPFTSVDLTNINLMNSFQNAIFTV